MSTLFLKIVNMSISASWLVLAVLMLRFVLKKAPKWMNVLLWGIVAVRLVCPFSMESALSLIPSAETIRPSILTDATPTVYTGVRAMNSVINPVIQTVFTPAVGASVNPLQIWIPVFSGLWLAGVLGLALYAAVSYWCLRRRVREAVMLRENIYQSERVSSPFVLGIVKPKIYLPYRMEGQSLNHVLAHEQAHICRRDHWWKPLGFGLLCVHWFNPLLWLAYVLLCRDIELACDERVIKDLGNAQRADYTQALVACSVSRRRIAACPLAFGEVGVKERVKSVMNYKKPTFWMVLLAVVICAAVAVCFLTNPRQERFDLRIVIPAGSQETVVYADEEISPLGGYFMVSAGQGLGDTEVSLAPVQYGQKGEYVSPIDLTPGMSAKLLAEKGEWYRIGVKVQNPTQQDLEVFLTVENVQVRVSCPAVGASRWFDCLLSPEENGSDRLETTLPELPGVTFRWTQGSMDALSNGKETQLYTGMPIWNTYFADLTGDGIPDLCSTLSFGSGMIDNRVLVYDYANSASYELSDRGNYDFTLRLNEADGQLYVDKAIYNTAEIVETGPLVFRNRCIEVDWMDVSEVSEGTTKYELTIGAEGVYYIELSLPDISGGCSNADESPFRKGERVWLEQLDGRQDLRGLTIQALDQDGAVIWTASVGENEGKTQLTQDGWTIQRTA